MAMENQYQYQYATATCRRKMQNCWIGERSSYIRIYTYVYLHNSQNGESQLNWPRAATKTRTNLHNWLKTFTHSPLATFSARRKVKAEWKSQSVNINPMPNFKHYGKGPNSNWNSIINLTFHWIFLAFLHQAHSSHCSIYQSKPLAN